MDDIVGNLVVRIGADGSAFISGMKDMTNAAVNSMAGITKAVSVGAAGVVASLGVVGAATAYVSKEWMKVDDEITKAMVNMRDMSLKTRETMTQTALEIARSGGTSAQLLASSYKVMAQAGYDAEKAVKALGVTEKFASANTYDQIKATELLTKAQKSLGLETKDAQQNAENMVSISDLLTKAGQMGAQSAQEFAEALSGKLGATVRNLKIPMEDTVALLNQFAEQGMRGSEGAGALTAVLKEMQSAVEKNKEKWQSLGIATFDSAGGMRGMADILKDMEKQMGGMSDQAQYSALTFLGFSDKSIQFTRSLLGTSKAVKDFSKEVKDNKNATASAAAEMDKTWGAQWGFFTNQINTLIVTLGDKLAPMLKVVAAYAANLAKDFIDTTNASHAMNNALETAIDMGEGLIKMWYGIMIVGQGVVIAWNLIKSAVTLVADSVVAAVTGIMNAYYKLTDANSTQAQVWAQAWDVASGKVSDTFNGTSKDIKDINGNIETAIGKIQKYWTDMDTAAGSFRKTVTDAAHAMGRMQDTEMSARDKAVTEAISNSESIKKATADVEAAQERYNNALAEQARLQADLQNKQKTAGVKSAISPESNARQLATQASIERGKYWDEMIKKEKENVERFAEQSGKDAVAALKKATPWYELPFLTQEKQDFTYAEGKGEGRAKETKRIQDLEASKPYWMESAYKDAYKTAIANSKKFFDDQAAGAEQMESAAQAVATAQERLQDSIESVNEAVRQEESAVDAVMEARRKADEEAAKAAAQKAKAEADREAALKNEKAILDQLAEKYGYTVQDFLKLKETAEQIHKTDVAYTSRQGAKDIGTMLAEGDISQNEAGRQIAGMNFTPAMASSVGGGFGKNYGQTFGASQAGDTGAFQLQDQASASDAEYNLRIEAAKAYYDQLEDITGEGQKAITELEKQQADERKAYSMAIAEVTLQQATMGFESLADITKQWAGENSKAYKIMFATSKAFAIADASVKIAQGIAGAATAEPWYMKIAAMASVAASTSSIVSNIRAVQMSFEGGGMTPDGPRIGGMDGKGGFPAILHPNEGVIDFEKPKESIDGALLGGGGSAPQVNITIINQAGGNIEAEQREGIDGKTIEVIIKRTKNEIANEARTGGGIVDTAYAQTFGLTRDNGSGR